MKTQIGRYEIKQELGQGGMGIVYKAYDPSLRREVAVKELLDHLNNDMDARVRFQQEANTMATLSHPAIVPVHDLGEQNNQPYFVMPYMSGGSLADRLRNGAMSLPQIKSILLHLADALDKVHDHGLIHRDIKPANILFDKDSRLYLADFGIARPIVPGTVTVTGTLAYMSPEQIAGQSLDSRSDVYQLGMVLFQMLTNTNKRDLPGPYDTPPSVYTYNANLPPGCDEVIARALATKKEDRYPTAGYLAAKFIVVLQEWVTNTRSQGQSVTNTPSQGQSGTNTPSQGQSVTNTRSQGQSVTNTRSQGQSVTNTHRRGKQPKSRFFRFWPVISIGILLGVAILVAVMFWPRGTTPIGLIISFTPPVDVKHGDSLQEAEVGLKLFEGDVVIAQANAGAVMSISCPEETLLFTLGAQQNMPLDCSMIADDNLIAQLNPDVISSEARSVVVLPAQQERSSRQAEAQTPILLTPRNTLIINTQPTFHWQGVPGASGYRLSLNIPNAENWEVETTETTLSYPADKAPLPAGGRIFVKLSTLDNPAEVEETSVNVIDEEERAELAASEAEIRNLGVDDTAQAYLLAQLYRQQEMNAAAIAQLEQIAAKGEAISGDLWQQLGDLYFESGLYTQAEEKYKNALSAAQTNNDQQIEAFAHFGLAQTAYVFNENQQALDYLTQAEALSDQIEDNALAEPVAKLKEKLEQ